MSTSVSADPSSRPDPHVPHSPALRNLYGARFAFALVWAALVAAHGSSLDWFSATLLVIYPLVDVSATLYDLRHAGSSGPRRALQVNAAISALAAVALVVATQAAIPDVLRVWGVWAVAAGVAQLVVGLRRQRTRGGQVAMILSGAISVLAGASFVASSSGHDATLTPLAGYAALGGIFFGVSAVLLHRLRR